MAEAKGETVELWELCRHGRGPSHYYSIDEAGATQGNLHCPGGTKYVIDWEAAARAYAAAPGQSPDAVWEEMEANVPKWIEAYRRESKPIVEAALGMDVTE